jgi:DNA mismatch endonuclease, patch repair protein
VSRNIQGSISQKMQALSNMGDVFSKSVRSRVMAAVRSRGNKSTELKLVTILREYGIKGWRRHRRLPGNPDFVFPHDRVVIFIDGCFWHGCRHHCRMPQDNQNYWQHKIARNQIRDKSVIISLRKNGWRVVRIWEHSLNSPELITRRINSMLRNVI